MPDTFYDVVRSKVNRTDIPAFPDLMTAFVHQFSRTDLVLEFFARVRYIDKFQDLRRRATRFHRAVGLNPFLNEIITTNWDDYFESEAGAIPLVNGADFDYWTVPARKVLKIHGSTLNPGSIVATRPEYERSLQALRTGALGATVRHLLATKSVVFAGYSMRDDDIRDMITALSKDLGSAAQRVYFVHPSSDFESPLDGATVLNTSAASFINQLVPSWSLGTTCCRLRCTSVSARSTNGLRPQWSARSRPFLTFRHPLSIYNHAYQDGVMHACHRLESYVKYGEDRARGHLVHVIRSYEEMSRRSLSKRDYWNHSYWEGYATGLIGPIAPEIPITSIPMYFCPGVGHETSLGRIAKAIRQGPDTHKTAYHWAERLVDRHGPDMVIEHTPFG